MSRSVRFARPALRVENLEARDVPAITGVVFQDADGDGIREPGDAGIAGVTVELLLRGAPADAVTTGTDGSYTFATVEPDDLYQITVGTDQAPLAGLTLSPANVGTDDAVDSDAVLSDTDAVVSFTTTSTTLAFDVGFTGGTANTLTLGGTVFADPDDTGTVTAVGVAGVKVELLAGATGETVLATATTDTAGLYQFTGLAAGTYRVRLAADMFSAGAVLAGFTPSSTAEPDPDNDQDDDSNGELSGTLGTGGTIVTGPITLALGEEPTGAGNTNLTVDFGVVGEVPVVSGGSLSGRVFLDYNNSGTFDGPDAGIAGVTVTLSGGALTAPVPVETDADGNFTFPSLGAGIYILTQTQPTTPVTATGKVTAGSAGGDATVANVVSAIALEADEDGTGYLFAEVPRLSTGGTVYTDADADGQFDTGEAGIPDVTVTLTGTSIVTGAAITPIVVTTNAAGAYTFTDLDPGTYTITETQPPGVTDGAEQNGTPAGTVGADAFTGIDLTTTAAASGGFNFGEASATTGGTGSIAGSVYTDTDGDGVKDETEAGIPGVTITLTGTDDEDEPVSLTATTGTDGSYSFTGLRPGTYALAETPPATGFTDGMETVGTAGGTLTAPDSITGITLTEGLAATGYLFGEAATSTGGTGSIAGSVFADADSDGVKDTAETGVSGVTITLTGTDDEDEPVSRTTTTGTDGSYSFTGLRAGTYAIAETPPATGFTDGAETVGTAGGTLTAPDSITGITLDAAEAATGYLFAETPTTGTGTGSIAGSVFSDADSDGIRDTAETGVSGVTVTLTGTDDQSQPVSRTATTATDGSYSFTGLRPGSYTIVETPPATGFTDGAETAGTAGGVTTTNDSISGITLTAGQAATGYLFAEVPDAEEAPAALRVRVRPDDSTVRRGDTVVLTYTVRNRGDGAATGVEVLARLGGLQFVSADGDYDPVTRIWTVGDVEGDGTATLEITATVPRSGTFTPSARLSAEDGAITVRNSSTTVTASSGRTALSASRFWFLSSGYTNRTPAPVTPPAPPATNTAGLTGAVFADADSDGVRDATETGVAGVTVTLTGTDNQGQPVSRTATTGSTGSYSFTGLRPGTYTVAETQPTTGFTDGAETVGTAGGTTTTNDQIAGITLTTGQAATGYLFAETPTTSTGTGSIAGSVFSDADSDGVKDTAETGVSGVTITLTGTDDQSQPVSRTTTTGTDGSYSFTGLRAGTYAIAETPPATGFTDGAETVGTAGGTLTAPDSITGITLDAAEAATGYLFAETPTTGTGTGSIAGSVFSDADSDGVRDTAETGVSGVTITLTGTDDQSQPVSQTATTGTDGSYSFTGLRAGTYTIAETPPATGFTDGAETAGTAGGVTTTNDSISGITLTAGLAATGYLFAEVPTATGGTASIAGSVFADADSDGVQDTGETGVSGVTVTLTGTDDQSQPVSRTATTGTDGSYSFTGLRAGTYTIVETPPATGFTDGAETAGTAGGVTTTNDSITGIELDAAEAATGYLFAEIPAATENSTPTVAAALAGVSVAAGATSTVDLAGTFDDADITNTLIRFNTSEGAINVELFDDQAPKTVANFLNYVTDGDYANAIFHRYAELENGTPFVLQGGGFAFDPDPTPSIVNIPADPAVQNEFSASRSPVLGTIAMAKLAGNPNSATNQFFFNLADNSSILNPQNGGFTVFGKLVGAADQAVVDALAAIPTQDQRNAAALPANQQGVFTDIPLDGYTGTAFPTDTTAANYALINGVTVVSQTEALTYSIVSNSNEAAATATISKNRLSIQGVAAGTTTITIRATDMAGATVDTTVTVTVA